MAAIQLSAPQKGDTLAVMHTNMGDIKFKLFPEKAPKTVENFVTHSKNGYYNGLKFHRVINDFMISSNRKTLTSASGPPNSFQLVISSSKTSFICAALSSCTGLALFTASTYPSSMTFLLKSPKASANKNTTISKIVMLVTKPLQVNIPSTIFSQTRFIQF